MKKHGPRGGGSLRSMGWRGERVMGQEGKS